MRGLAPGARATLSGLAHPHCVRNFQTLTQYDVVVQLTQCTPQCVIRSGATRYTVWAGCKCAWNGNVHFSRGPRSKLYTHCRSTATGPGPPGWVGSTSPAPGPAADRPSWGGAAAGRRPDRARGAPAVHQAGRSDAQRPGNAFPCGKARRHRSAGGPGRLC